MKNRIKLLLLLTAATAHQSNSGDFMSMEPMEPIDTIEPMDALDPADLTLIEVADPTEITDATGTTDGAPVETGLPSQQDHVVIQDTATNSGSFANKSIVETSTTNEQLALTDGAEETSNEQLALTDGSEPSNQTIFGENELSMTEAQDQISESVNGIDENSTSDEIKNSAVESIEAGEKAGMTAWEAFKQWVSDLFNNWENRGNSWKTFWDILTDVTDLLENEFSELNGSSLESTPAPEALTSSYVTAAEEQAAIEKLNSLGANIPEKYTNDDLSQAIRDSNVLRSSELADLVDATVTLSEALKQRALIEPTEFGQEAETEAQTEEPLVEDKTEVTPVDTSSMDPHTVEGAQEILEAIGADPLPENFTYNDVENSTNNGKVSLTGVDANKYTDAIITLMQDAMSR